MGAKTSRDLNEQSPRKDTEKDQQKAAIKDAAENDGKDRDTVHGDGDTIGLDK